MLCMFYVVIEKKNSLCFKNTYRIYFILLSYFPSLQTADYMVSFMDYVDPSKKMLECRLQAKIRGVKRPIGVTVLPDQSVVVSSSGEPNEVSIILK